MAAPAKRIDGIDFWRGFALLTIFIDHMPETVFQHVTQKNFGFSDAAELFVFLSGVSIALAYGTRFFDGETVVAVRAVLRRAFTLYWVQILISLVIIGVFAGRRIKRGGIAYDPRLFAACLAVVAIAAVVRTDSFGYASGLWQHVHDMLDCGKTDLGFARLVHFLALAYIVYHSGLTGLMRRTRTFLPLCLIGRYSLPVFATGTVLSAMGEVIVETRSEAFSHELALGAAIVAGGILMHYLVARGLAAWRDGQRANVLAVAGD